MYVMFYITFNITVSFQLFLQTASLYSMMPNLNPQKLQALKIESLQVQIIGVYIYVIVVLHISDQ